MKTPREILLEKHGAATWKLDAARRRALDAIAVQAAPFGAGQIPWWRGLLWRHALPLALLWTVIVGVHVSASTAEPSEPRVGKFAAQVLLPAQRPELVRELLGFYPEGAALEEPDPKPRTELFDVLNRC